MRFNTARAFLFFFKDEENPTNPMWYAGLGQPFKTTSNIQFAKSVVFDSTESKMLMRSLEKHYGKTIHQIPLKDAMPTPNFRCEGCGLGWTHKEAEVAALVHGGVSVEDEWVLHDLISSHLFETHLGSLMRCDNKDSFSFGEKIHGSRRCINENCMSLFCGDCAPPRRGRNAGFCKVCKPSRRRS